MTAADERVEFEIAILSQTCSIHKWGVKSKSQLTVLRV